MSAVRMCDRCGNIFSENSVGWQMYQGTTRKRSADGGVTFPTVNMDACADCAVDHDVEPLTPTIKGAPAIERSDA